MTNLQFSRIAVSALCALALTSTRALAADSEKSDSGPFSVGASIGYQTGNSISQIRLAAEGQYALMKLAPKVELDLAGHLGFLTGDSVTTIEIVPAGRVRYLLDPKLSLYGSAGVGPAFVSVSVGSLSASKTWFLIRFAGGAQYNVAPNLALFAEPAVNIYAGDGSGTQFGVSGGGLFRF